jgi:hypothetical protein
MNLYRRLFWPDTHAPYHDAKAVEIAIEIGKELAPHELVIQGDFFDCYTISDYAKDPLKATRTLSEELEEGRALLARLEKELKPKSVVFIEGNHEDRVSRYLRNHASKLVGTMSCRDILGVPKHWRWVPFGPHNRYLAGNLIVTHGTRAGKHCAFAMADAYKTSVLFGHTHRIQEFNMRTARGELIKGITNGWLGDIDRAAEYVQDVANWSHAVTAGLFKPTGEFWLNTVEIENYEAVFNGKFFTK